ncbi:hypothetical protein BAUCODRAFT_34258 [Baudoinia panamericana UAMH 10762]|uniref:Uncharacterized protein n=1 Tax=Baudoinia panamericana (strain UAMH 10762) TaxID=717646 RepID=M2MZ16_BAUPA|nr:uncharacterized protein BAUCODRAFT_34258 [Baudoinia panamericana UAMH 10762]EMC96858.1 hypothetical protein BAUCODRAFT_34258 [Baudoinia panamericana UAMH 10762]
MARMVGIVKDISVACLPASTTSHGAVDGIVLLLRHRPKQAFARPSSFRPISGDPAGACGDQSHNNSVAKGKRSTNPFTAWDGLEHDTAASRRGEWRAALYAVHEDYRQQPRQQMLR